MNDLPIIIKREYLNRVRRKSFLLMTLLTPLFFIAAMIIPSTMMNDVIEKESILIFGDKNGYYTDALQQNSEYTFVEATDEYLENTDPSKSFSAMLYLPEVLDEMPNMAMLVSNYELSERLQNHLNQRLSEAATMEKWRKGSSNLYEIWKENKVEVHCQSMKNVQSGSSSDETAALVSIIVSFLLYIFIFSYGSQVMRGVTEEKSNKIMEVMFLSTRASHLMAGKIIGIALVGLTQFVLWAGVAGFIFHSISDHESIATTLHGITLPEASNIYGLGAYFVLFFLAGYLLYASLFAIIGALSVPGTDTQQFFLPVTIPILFSIYAGIYTACHPESELALWCSHIPFTSPIVMLARICHNVSLMEIGISFFILVVTDILLFHLAGKIYKSAILLHGKKITYKDLWDFCKG